MIPPDEREKLASIEARYYEAPDFKHCDECPMSDDFEGGDDEDPECICAELLKERKEALTYDQWKARILGA